MIKRILLWFLSIVAVLVVAIVLAFRFTPWPSVAIIQEAFSRGDQASEAALEKHAPDNVVTRRDLTYGEEPDEIFDINYPDGADRPLPTIVWVHGGGWVAGSKDGIANYLKVLAGHGYTTVGVEYSHGFGSTYPKPVEQVNAALGYLVRNAAELNVDPDTIILAGDSAGAQIASQLAVIITDPSYAERMGIPPLLEPERLSAILLLSGGFDIEAVDLEGDFGWFLKTVLWAYSGNQGFPERRAVQADLGGALCHRCIPARLRLQRQRRSSRAAGGGPGAKVGTAWRQGGQPFLPCQLLSAAAA
jgi:acetyl esterase